MIVGALQSNGTKYGKQYGKDRLYSKTKNIRSKVKISERSSRPKYNIPLSVGSNFNFVPEKVKDDERVVEQGESPVQSSQSFRGLLVPYRDNYYNINNNRSLPSVMLANARSLFNKINELEIVAKMQEIDVVCITETWLKDQIPNEAIDCLGMNLCRLDRTNVAGGGITVFINNTIPFKVRGHSISKSFECIWVTIRPTWLPREISRICISCVYLPPCQTDVEGFYEYFYNCYDKLCMESPNSAFIVAGVFNPTNNGFQN